MPMDIDYGLWYFINDNEKYYIKEKKGIYYLFGVHSVLSCTFGAPDNPMK